MRRCPALQRDLSSQAFTFVTIINADPVESVPYSIW